MMAGKKDPSSDWLKNPGSESWGDSAFILNRTKKLFHG